MFVLGAGVPITSPQMYSAGHTDDLRQAVYYIAHRYPNAPLLGLGFSLGANVLTRYLAEEGSRSRIISGCALACVTKTFLLHPQCFTYFHFSIALGSCKK